MKRGGSRLYVKVLFCLINYFILLQVVAPCQVIIIIANYFETLGLGLGLAGGVRKGWEAHNQAKQDEIY